MEKNRHILHTAARKRGDSLRTAVLIAALAVLAGATAAVQPAQAQGERTVSIEPHTSHVMPGTIQTLTLQVVPRLPAAARLTITKGGDEADHISLPDPATVTIPPGASFATFDIALAAEAMTDSTGTVSISDAVFIHTDDMNITRTTNTLVIGGELFELSIDGAADTATILVGAQPDGTVNICARTPQVEAAILTRSRVAEMDCAVAPQAQLNTVTLLNLLRQIPSTTTTTLKDDDFANLGNLATLNLGINGLETLPADVFDGLPNLTFLNLGTNDLVSLDENLFDGLSALQMLFLDTNNLTSLDENLFDDLSALQMLFLDNNNLASLDENLFDGLSALTRLDLSNSNLASLDENLFDGLSALTRLDLNNNNLASLPTGIFDDVLDTLTDLTLNNQGNDVDLRSTVSIEPSTVVIGPNAVQTFTARLTPPSPAIVRLTIIASGDQASHVTLPDPATVTIPAGMASANFNITLAAEATAGDTGTVAFSAPALIYTDTSGMEQSNTDIVNRLVSIPSTFTSTFTVATPSATYDPDDPTAVEPISTTATANPATFILRLINLTSAQTNLAAQRGFFFNPGSNDFSAIGNVLYIPGYGTLPDGITAANWDNDFTLEYLPADGNPTADDEFIKADNNVTYLRSGGGIPKTPSETYTFRVTPKHDGNDEGREHVVFGYRVFFSGQGDDQEQLRGVVDSDSAVTIMEGGDVIRLRVRTFLEGALQ